MSLAYHQNPGDISRRIIIKKRAHQCDKGRERIEALKKDIERVQTKQTSALLGPDLMDLLVQRYEPKGTCAQISHVWRIGDGPGTSPLDIAKLARVFDNASPFELC